METKKEYIAPELTVVSFKTERGYAASNQLSNLVQVLVGFNAYGIQNWGEEVTVEDNTNWGGWT